MRDDDDDEVKQEVGMVAQKMWVARNDDNIEAKQKWKINVCDSINYISHVCV